MTQRKLEDVALGITAIGAMVLAGALVLGSLYAAVVFMERYSIRPDFSGRF